MGLYKVIPHKATPASRSSALAIAGAGPVPLRLQPRRWRGAQALTIYRGQIRMTAIRFIFNALIMAGEVAAVAAVAWLGFAHPLIFSGATAALALLLGIKLEAARLNPELPFYFDNRKPGPLRALLVPLVGGTEALMKAVLASVAALFTFSGTNHDRLFYVAIMFGITVFAGAAILRALSIRLNAIPSRWGFFRLGPPLGLLFSAGLAALIATSVIPSASLSDLGWKIIWDMPSHPSVDQVSELVFQIKQAFDDFVVTILATFLPPNWAQVVGIFISVNVLAGFVAAVYAAIIASFVRTAEKAAL